jgi:hypothetical protein
LQEGCKFAHENPTLCPITSSSVQVVCIRYSCTEDQSIKVDDNDNDEGEYIYLSVALKEAEVDKSIFQALHIWSSF